MTHDQSYPEITSACAQFVMWALMEGSWQGADVDGGDAQDKAASLGLISEVPYDPEKHGSSDGLEPGESWYVPTEELLALLRMSQPASVAQGSPEPDAWQWRYVGDRYWKTRSGGLKLTPSDTKNERPIEQRPLYASSLPSTTGGGVA